MANITIDGVDYDSETFTKEALDQLGALQFVDSKITQLQSEIAALQTARNAYGQALAALISEETKLD
jgi:hypothetical protein